MEKSHRKCALKASHRPLFNFGKYPKQTLHAQNSFKNKFKKEDFKEDYLFKEDYQKPFKKSTLSFLSNPVPFNGQSYQKQKGPETSDQSFFRL